VDAQFTHAHTQDHVHIVRWLIEQGGATTQERDASTGQTPLLVAVQAGSVRTARVLLEGGASMTEVDHAWRTVWTLFNRHCDESDQAPRHKLAMYGLLCKHERQAIRANE
jgi:hypothetical protein